MTSGENGPNQVFGNLAKLRVVGWATSALDGLYRDFVGLQIGNTIGANAKMFFKHRTLLLRKLTVQVFH